MAVVGTAEVLVRPTFSGFQKAVGKQMGGLGPQGEAVGSTLGSRVSGGFKKAAAVGLAAAGGVVVGGLGAALTKGLGRLTAIENAQAKMRGLGHDTEAVDAIMKNALASVKGTAFGLGDAATVAASMVAAGIEPGEKLEGVLKSVANSAAAAGTDLSDMGSVYGKVASLGKAQNDSLQQVADKGIPIYQALADQLGVTTEEVFKLASDGAISFAQFEEAMTSASGTVASEMGKTFTGSLSNAWAALGRVGANLLSGVFDKFAPAIQGATGWLEKLEPVAKNVGQAIGDFATRATDGIKALWDLLVRGDFTKAFREAFNVEEDSAVVGFLFGLRDAALKVFTEVRGGIWAFQGAWSAFDGEVTSSGFPGFMERVAFIARTLWTELTGGLHAFTAAWTYNDGEVTSSGFPGVMERIGYYARQAFDYIQGTAIPAVQNFIAEFRNGEGAGGKFRDILNGVKDAAITAFTWIRDEGLPALMALGDFILNKLWPDIRTAFMDYILPALAEAGRVIKNFWEQDGKPALEGLWKFVRDTLAPFLADFYENGIKPTFKLIGDAIKGAWENVIKPTFARLKEDGTALKDRFNTVKDGIVRAWDAVSAGVEAGWLVVRGVFDRFKAGLDSVRDKFSSAKDGIGRAWSALGGIIARAINPVIDTVNRFLSGLHGALGKIPGVTLGAVWQIAQVPAPAAQTSSASTAGSGRGGRGIQRLRDGGLVRGPWLGPKADNVLGLDARGIPTARVNPNEMVLSVAGTKKLMKQVGMSGLNMLNRGIIPGFNRGGIISNRPGTGGALDRSWEFVTDLWNRGRGWVKDVFDRLMPDFGGSWAGMAAKGAIQSLNLSKIAEYLKEKSLGALGGSNAPMTGGQRVNYGGAYGWAPRGMGTAAMRALLAVLAPEAQVTSGYRPGSITASGIRSLHAEDRALDIVSGNMRETFMKLLAAFGGVASQLYYSPMGGLQVGYRDAAVHNMHFDHIHWGMADGGLVKPLLFDSGGYLPTGTSLVHNATGKPEPLMRMDKPMQITGTLQIGGDGLARIIDGRILEADERGAYHDRRQYGHVG